MPVPLREAFAFLMYRNSNLIRSYYSIALDTEVCLYKGHRIEKMPLKETIELAVNYYLLVGMPNAG